MHAVRNVRGAGIEGGLIYVGNYKIYRCNFGVACFPTVYGGRHKKTRGIRGNHNTSCTTPTCAARSTLSLIVYPAF